MAVYYYDIDYDPPKRTMRELSDAELEARRQYLRNCRKAGVLPEALPEQDRLILDPPYNQERYTQEDLFAGRLMEAERIGEYKYPLSVKGNLGVNGVWTAQDAADGHCPVQLVGMLRPDSWRGQGSLREPEATLASVKGDILQTYRNRGGIRLFEELADKNPKRFLEILLQTLIEDTSPKSQDTLKIVRSILNNTPNE